MGNEQPRIRLSPSGMEIGNPPASIGGNSVAGREWLAQGTDVNQVQVPGTAAGDIMTMDTDLKASNSGFKYDIQCETNTYGTGGEYRMILLGSTNGGTDGYPVALITPGASDDIFNSGTGRITSFGTLTVPGNLAINKVKMQMQRAVPAGTGLLYVPAQTRIYIREISNIT